LDGHCSLVGESTEVATHRDREKEREKERKEKKGEEKVRKNK